MRDTALPNCPLRVTNHFLARLHERFPHLHVSESDLQRALARAEWYPAGGNSTAYYALCQIGELRLVLVVSIQQHLAHLVTVYQPRPGWDRRLPAARPWSLGLVLAASA